MPLVPVAKPAKVVTKAGEVLDALLAGCRDHARETQAYQTERDEEAIEHECPGSFEITAVDEFDAEDCDQYQYQVRGKAVSTIK